MTEHDAQPFRTALARDTRGATTLPGRFYHSDEIFAEESDRIFRRHWICAGRRDELFQGDTTCVVRINEESLLLTQDAVNSKEIRGFMNVCRHRGTLLCEAEHSSPKTIRCPYHAWTWNRAGELIAAPNMQDDFCLGDFPLFKVHVCDWHGFVFVNFAENPQPLNKQIPALTKKLSHWNLSELIVAARLDYDVAANWKLLFQNFSECYHCPGVHPALNRMSTYDTAVNDIQEELVLGGPMNLVDHVDSMTTSGRACATTLPNLAPGDERRVFYYTLFPTLFISPHPDFVLVHRLERVAMGRTKIVCEFLFHPDSREQKQTDEERDFDPSPATEFWDLTNRQDWHVCELAQRGTASTLWNPGPYSDLECTVAAFDEFYLQQMGRAN